MSERFIRTRLAEARLNPTILLPGEERPFREKVLSRGASRINGNGLRTTLNGVFDPIKSTRQLERLAAEIQLDTGEQRGLGLPDTDSETSPAGIYLRDISRTPLLTANQEVRLAQAIEKGRKAERSLAKVPPEEEEKRKKLEDEQKKGDQARKKLIESNLRLVVSVARKYIGRGLPFLDLVQEGNIGLERSADKFDWRKGFRFSTYAYWWIRQAVTRAIHEDGRTIRLPVHVGEDLSRLEKARKQIEQQTGSLDVTAEMLADSLKIKVKKVIELQRAGMLPVSIHQAVGEEGDGELIDLIEDQSTSDMAEEAHRRELSKDTQVALAKDLTPREIAVLRMRFGLGGTEQLTLTEVGKELGISRERARQIEGNAMRKLKNPKSEARKKLGAYL